MTLRVIDSHTAGEPTRVVLEGGVPLAGETMLERREEFRANYDHLRTGIVLEPRGSDVLVGAALTPPINPDSAAGIVFFNNAGYLGMCGHGTIGVVETLKYLGRINERTIRLDTPAGTVTATILDNGDVSLSNVLSYVYAQHITLQVEGFGEVHGDVAYGGNWFFLVHEPEFEINLRRAAELTQLTERIKQTLARSGIMGADGAEIDHVELSGPSGSAANSRNFVLCPGGAYDRSPCGTGTSAKLASLFAAGRLKEGEIYVQESVAGGVFRGQVRAAENGVQPTIAGRAYITADSTLLFQEDDPLRWGIGGV